MLSRRLFLGSLIGGATLVTAGATLAMPSNRYQVLIEMQRTLYEDNRVARSFLHGTHEMAQEYYRRLPSVQTKLNALVEYLLAEFNRTDLTDDAVIRSVQNAMFVTPANIDVMAEEDLAAIEDAVVVMTVVRHLYHVEHVQFSSFQNGKGHLWNDVVDRYRVIEQPPTATRRYSMYWWARDRSAA